MPEATRATLRRYGTAALLFMLAGAFRRIDIAILSDSFQWVLLSAACFVASNLLYVGLTFAWGMAIHRRILHREMRRYLMLCCATVLLWFTLRIMKYRFFENEPILRSLWYLYYVPQILAPLWSFFASLQLGQREGATLAPAWRVLYIPALALVIGILTNDLHQLAFRFAPDMINWNSDYVHGPLYFLAIGWMFLFMIATVAVMYRKCRISESRSRAWIPLCTFAAGSLLSLLTHLNIYQIHRLPECCCLTFIALWESCLLIGLLPTNRRYRQFFAEGTLSAQIADRQGQVRYRARTAPILTPEQMRAAGEGPFYLDADTLLRSAPIRDGRVYWVENLSQIHRIQAQLEEIHAQLTKENELIRAEADLKQRQAQIEESIRLYDRIETALRPQLDQMDVLLTGKQRSNLLLVCILGAYVKRRGNLMLICEREKTASLDELAYCIRESLIYLDAYGAACSFYQEGQGSVCGETLLAAYDFFENALEAALPTLSALLVRVECSQRHSIRLMMDDAARLPDCERFARMGELSIDQTDGTLCLTLCFPGEVN